MKLGLGFGVVSVTVAAVAFGCSPAASRKPAGSPTETTSSSASTTDATSGNVGGIDGWYYAPTPGRSLARLRANLEGAPTAVAAVDHFVSTIKPFDLEQPIYGYTKSGVVLGSYALRPEVAAQIKSTGWDGKNECAPQQVKGAMRLICTSHGDLSDEMKAETEKYGSEKATTDLHMEMGAAAWAKANALFASIAGPSGRPILSSGDFGKTSFDVLLEGTPELRASIHLNDKGPLAKALLEAPVAPPPSSFFKMPKDAELALYMHAPAAEEQAATKAAFFDLIMNQAFEGCTDAEKQWARSEFEKLFFTGGDVSIAIGFDRARSEGAAGAVVGAPSDKRKAKAFHDTAQPWILVALDEPAERWSKGLSTVINGRCKTDTKTKGAKKPRVARKPSARGGALPAGTLVLPATDDTSDTFVIMPDKSQGKERTWIAFGHGEALLTDRLRNVASGGTENSLAARPAVASLKTPATFAGFVTPVFFAFLDESDKAPVKSALRLVRAKNLATGGRTPLLFRAAVIRDERAGGDLNVRITASGATISDFFAIEGPKEAANDGESDQQ